MVGKLVVAAILSIALCVAIPTNFAAAGSAGNPWAWGLNADGQLGNGTVTQYSGLSSPVQATNFSSVASVAGGDRHSLALRSDGTVWAWGNSGWGQLGQGTYGSSSKPIQVPGLSNVTAIAAGSLSNLALKSDGTVWGWGFNYYGQVGNGTSGGNVLSPVQVKGLYGVIHIAAGGYTSLAIRSDRTVWAWGYNGLGELGHGTSDETAHSIPARVSSLTSVTSVSASFDHSLAVVTDGTVWAWGDNETSQLGATTTSTCGAYGTPCSKVPVRAGSLSGITAVAAGSGFSLALASDGTAWGWGGNGYGELGTGKSQLFGGIKTPVKAKVSGVTAIAAGAAHSLWLRSDATVWAAGGNYDGQLGNGTFNDSSTPVQVPLSGMSAIGAGHDHSLALKSG